MIPSAKTLSRSIVILQAKAVKNVWMSQRKMNFYFNGSGCALVFLFAYLLFFVSAVQQVLRLGVVVCLSFFSVMFCKFCCVKTRPGIEKTAASIMLMKV